MNTGRVIIETFQGKNPVYIPAVLCKNHGPFTWGRTRLEAVHNAVVLEGDCQDEFHDGTHQSPGRTSPQCMQDKHFMQAWAQCLLRTGEINASEVFKK